LEGKKINFFLVIFNFQLVKVK